MERKWDELNTCTRCPVLDAGLRPVKATLMLASPLHSFQHGLSAKCNYRQCPSLNTYTQQFTPCSHHPRPMKCAVSRQNSARYPLNPVDAGNVLHHVAMSHPVKQTSHQSHCHSTPPPAQASDASAIVYGRSLPLKLAATLNLLQTMKNCRRRKNATSSMVFQR